jgi:DNA-binding transcriptional MerR regulator
VAVPRRLIKMSELAALSGVPAATIKHYLREHLLGKPARRTHRNMAYYDARLADRVKLIKQLQNERFLPLKVIGELLEPSPGARIRDDLDRAERAQLGALAPAVAIALDRGVERTRADILASMPVTEAELDWLDRAGIVSPVVTGGVVVYRGVDVELLQVLADIRGQALGDIFPLSLVEPYAAAVRAMIRVEIDMFRRRVQGSGLPLPRPLPEIARQAVDIGQRLIVGLRAKLLPPELAAVAAMSEPPDTGSP